LDSRQGHVSSPQCPDGFWGPPSLLSTGGSFSGGKTVGAWSWDTTARINLSSSSISYRFSRNAGYFCFRYMVSMQQNLSSHLIHPKKIHVLVNSYSTNGLNEILAILRIFMIFLRFARKMPGHYRTLSHNFLPNYALLTHHSHIL
jgi:hypothetical protein